MQAIKGIIQNGVIHPDEPVTEQEGQSIVILFVENTSSSTFMNEATWDELDRLLEECQIDTGISDLAHQHDHYIHGTPKREPYP